MRATNTEITAKGFPCFPKTEVSLGFIQDATFPMILRSTSRTISKANKYRDKALGDLLLATYLQRQVVHGPKLLGPFITAFLLAIASGDFTQRCFPEKSTFAEEPQVKVTRDLVFCEVGEQKLKADLYRLDDETRKPVVIMIHGGGWAAGDKWHMADHARQLAREGFVAFSVNYRLAPQWKFPAQVEDCREALKWVQQNADKYQMDPDRLALYGYSAGAHLAALLGCNPQPGLPPVKAVVAGGAPCDFTELSLENRTMAYFLGGSREEKPDVYRQASPKAFASKDDPPFFFFHGDVDRIVPLHNSRCLHDALQKCGIDSQFHEVTGQGHLLTFVNPEARLKAVEFLQKKLQVSTTEKSGDEDKEPAREGSVEMPSIDTKGGH
ncbi:MAG: Carboxylesterase NlhH [Planctomycetota bacterium]|jgi:triacylglycerol lipase